MIRARKVDANQADVVKVFRAAGATVECLHAVGGGVPDLLIGWHGQNLLVEVKDGTKSPSQRSLTKDQVAWHHAWTGSIHVVESIRHAIEVLLAYSTPAQIPSVRNRLIIAGYEVR